MFDKLKQFKQIKELQNAFAQERVTIEKESIKVVMTGKLEVESVQLNSLLEKEKQEKIVRDCFNEAIKKMNFQIAQKMSKMTGLSL